MAGGCQVNEHGKQPQLPQALPATAASQPGLVLAASRTLANALAHPPATRMPGSLPNRPTAAGHSCVPHRRDHPAVYNAPPARCICPLHLPTRRTCVEATLLDQHARDVSPHSVEVICSVRCLPNQHKLHVGMVCYVPLSSAVYGSGSAHG